MRNKILFLKHLPPPPPSPSSQAWLHPQILYLPPVSGAGGPGVGFAVSSSHVVSATPSSSGGGLLTPCPCSSMMRSLSRETALYKLLQRESFPRAAALHKLPQCGSFPRGAVLQEQAAPAWVPHRVTSPAGKPAPARAPLSTGPQVLAGACHFSAGFSPSEICYPSGAATVADGLGLGQKQVHVRAGFIRHGGSFSQLLTEGTPIAPPLPKPCHTCQEPKPTTTCQEVCCYNFNIFPGSFFFRILLLWLKYFGMGRESGKRGRTGAGVWWIPGSACTGHFFGWNIVIPRYAHILPFRLCNYKIWVRLD